jgi:hypothetical protein
VSDVVDDLLAEVRAARRAGAALKRHNDRIKELLVQVRREHPELGLADIEEKIDRYYDRATISRVTVPQLGDDLTRKPTRKRS